MLNKYQKEAFHDEAVKIAEKKKEEGYMATDLTAIGYYLLKNNIEQAENIEEGLEGLDDLMSRAESLLGEIEK